MTFLCRLTFFFSMTKFRCLPKSQDINWAVLVTRAGSLRVIELSRLRSTVAASWRVRIFWIFWIFLTHCRLSSLIQDWHSPVHSGRFSTFAKITLPTLVDFKCIWWCPISLCCEMAHARVERDKMAEWKSSVGIGSFLDEFMNKVIRILQSEQLENTPHLSRICRSAS